MKKIAYLVVAVVALALLFSTCKKESTTSDDECVGNFMDDINSADRSGVYRNLDSGASKYNQAKTPAFWDALLPPAGISYSLSGKYQASNYIYATLKSSSGYATYASGVPIIFTMGDDSDKNAVISAISISSAPIFN